MKYRCAVIFGLLGAAAVYAAPSSFATRVQPFITRNCVGCHNARSASGGLNLQAHGAASFATTDRDLWERVAARVRAGEMPPAPLPRLKAEDVDAFAGFIEDEFARIDRRTPPDPGRVTARRLNRYEYNNTIRDLLGVTFRPGTDFPADDSGYGFDNIGDVLTVSPVLMEKYLAAAEQIAKVAISADPPPKPALERHRNERSAVAPARMEYTDTFAVEGDYDFRAAINGLRPPFMAGESVPHTISIYADGRLAGSNQTDTDPDRRTVKEARVHLAAGRHTIRAELTTPACDLPSQLRVELIEVRGPYDPVPAPPPASHRRIFVCGHANGQHTAACARPIVGTLLRRAFRRSVQPAEVDKYVRFIDLARQEGDSFEQGVQLALEAVLVSPEFLFRIERDPKPTDPKAIHRLGDFELASRLSYFLWSSQPDDELLDAAERGKLDVSAQVSRMLRNPKASALVENFCGQWLALRNLDSVQPDPARFPEFTDRLRADIRRETQLFIESIIHDDRSILDFLSARYTFLNEPLAKFYGIEGVRGPEFRRVELATPQRMGILTQASVLTVSSYPTRTSPVIRGKYVLQNILNAPPPPPPPDVPSLDDSKVGSAMSMRQQLEAHRANAVCASCHSKMDPLGFGLENYDAIGRWRAADGKFPIDASGTLPGGRSFSTPAEMLRILIENREAFARCLTEKLLIYALGRGLERSDRPAVDEIVRAAAKQDYRFSSLILEIANSMPFRMRRGEAPIRSSLEHKR